MKIKIIDLLNKIANGEEVPKKIKFCNRVYKYRAESNLYVSETDTLGGDYALDTVLHFTAEIIEEDKTIEELDGNLKVDTLKEPYGVNEEIIWIEIVKQQNKINELVKEINKLKEN